MTQKGTHTWDLNLSYHRCPKCGVIFENREAYEYRFGIYQKELQCPRCQYIYTITKERKPAFGPLTGDPNPSEVDWS